MLHKRRNGRSRRPLFIELLEDRTLLSGVVTALQDPLTGVLRITGDAGNNHITISQIAPGVLRVAGDINIAPPPSRPDVTSVNGVAFADFTLASISAIDITMLNGTDRVTMTGFSILGNITITAGSGVDTFSLNSIQTNAGIISIIASGSDMITESDVVAGSSIITTGPGPATITQSNVTLGFDIINTTGAANISIVNSTFRPPPRSWAIGVLTINADTTVVYSNSTTNTVYLDKINVGPTTINVATGPGNQQAKDNFTFDNSTLQGAAIQIGAETAGSATTNTVDISRDIVTGTGDNANPADPAKNLSVFLLNQSGVSGVLADGTTPAPAPGNGSINNLTMNNVQFTNGGNLNVRVDDGLTYVNSSNVLIAASTVLMELVDTSGVINLTLGDHFQSVMLGTGTIGLNDLDAGVLNVSIGNDNDIIVISANLVGDGGNETISIGDVTTSPIGGSAAPSPSVLINGVWSNDGDENVTILLGNNNRIDLGAGWPITVNETVGGNLTIGPRVAGQGNGWNLTVANTSVGGTLNITMGNGGPGITETLTLSNVIANDLNITLDSKASDTPDGNPNAGVTISLVNVQVNDPLGGLSLIDLGAGADALTMTLVNVVEALNVILSSGINIVVAQSVTTGFGIIDGGSGPSNLYVDRGGNFGYFIIRFAGQLAGPNPPVMEASNLSLSASAVNQGDTVTLTGTFSQPGDPDGHTVTIDWGDGTANTQLQLAPGVFTFNATHQYLNEPPTGTSFKITATVANSAGDMAKASISITVNDVPPVIPVGGLQLNSTAVVGIPFSLAGTFIDPDMSNPHQVVINWGDGSSPTSFTVGAGVFTFGPVSHTYQTSSPPDSPFTIQVTISDEDKVSTSASARVTVIGGVPSGSPTGSPVPSLTLSGASRVNEGSTYTLDLSSRLPTGTTISSVTITWGDGQVQTVAGNPSSVTHVYSEGPNNYTILAQAADQSGTLAANNTVGVQVMDMPPTLTLAGPNSANPLSPYTLSLSSSDPGTDPITGWTISWGDGTTDSVVGDPSSVTHSYALEHRNYTISAQATNGDGTFSAGNTMTVNMAFATANENFIAQVYLDLLGRPVDLGGLQSWTAHLQDGMSRAEVVLWITQSLEYRTLEVEQLYQTYLGREADPEGLRGDIVALGAGVTIDQIKAAILSSDEYFSQRANGSLTGYFSALYTDVLGRSAIPSEIETWLAGEPADVSRTTLASQFITSMEANQFLVQSLYQKYLNRNADADGLSGFVQSRANGATVEAVIASILGSDEYYQRAVS
jgi:hypothetical protein